MLILYPATLLDSIINSDILSGAAFGSSRYIIIPVINGSFVSLQFLHLFSPLSGHATLCPQNSTECSGKGTSLSCSWLQIKSFQCFTIKHGFSLDFFLLWLNIHNLNFALLQFSASDSGVLRTFSLVCDHHRHLTPGLFHHLKQKLYTH